MYTRPILALLLRRIQEPRRFLQVLTGPRQVGKTTLARQAMADFGEHSTYATADNPAPSDWCGWNNSGSLPGCGAGKAVRGF
jgi:uncharacterized protein